MVAVKRYSAFVCLETIVVASDRPTSLLPAEEDQADGWFWAALDLPSAAQAAGTYSEEQMDTRNGCRSTVGEGRYGPSQDTPEQLGVRGPMTNSI